MQSIFIQSTKYLQFEVKSICKLIECFSLLSTMFSTNRNYVIYYALSATSLLRYILISTSSNRYLAI